MDITGKLLFALSISAISLNAPAKENFRFIGSLFVKRIENVLKHDFVWNNSWIEFRQSFFRQAPWQELGWIGDYNKAGIDGNLG